jgi:hypothetical protein
MLQKIRSKPPARPTTPTTCLMSEHNMHDDGHRPTGVRILIIIVVETSYWLAVVVSDYYYCYYVIIISR